MITVVIGFYCTSQPQVIKLEIDKACTASNLLLELAKVINKDLSNYELFYENKVLTDSEPLYQSLKAESNYIQVLMKKLEPPAVEPESPERVCAQFQFIKQASITNSERENALEAIMAKCPEIRTNLGVQALLRDPVLFSSLDQEDVIVNIQKYYPVICKSAKLIVSAMMFELSKHDSIDTEMESAITSSSSSEEGDRDPLGIVQNRPSTSIPYAHFISRQQLESAIASAHSAFTTHNDENATTSSAATASAPVEQMDTSEPVSTVDNISNITESTELLPPDYRQHEYAEQLRTMAQMGFVNYSQNVAFLTMAHGDINYAISLLMASLT